MIYLPGQKYSIKTLPFAAIAITLITIVSFFGWQLKSEEARLSAMNYYYESGLADIEIPLYIAFARQNISEPEYSKRLEKIANREYSQYQIYWLMRFDPYFQNKLKNSQVFSQERLYYWHWQEKLRNYQAKLDKDFSLQKAFKPNNLSFKSALVSFFIFPNIIEFLIITLILACSLVIINQRLGLKQLLVYYFGGGFILLASQVGLNPVSMLPVYAINGALAALVGVIVGLWISKKQRYFEVRFLKKTKLLSVGLILGAWLGWLALQYFYFNVSALNLCTTLVSFTFGIMGYWCFGKKTIEKAYTTGFDKNSIEFKLNIAANEIANFNLDGAKRILYQLNELEPNNPKVLFQLFNALKSFPASEEYHNVVSRIFSLKKPAKSEFGMLNMVFKNYIRRAEPFIRYNIEDFLRLSQVFRKNGYYEDSETILKILIENDEIKTNSSLQDLVAREILLLAKNYFANQDISHAYRLLELIAEKYPMTDSGKQAIGLINSQKAG